MDNGINDSDKELLRAAAGSFLRKDGNAEFFTTPGGRELKLYL